PTPWTDGSALSAPPIVPPRLSPAGAPAEPPAPAQATLALETPDGQTPTIVRDLPALDRLVKAFSAAERAGFQVVLADEMPRRGRLAGIVIALDERPVYYIHLAHAHERCLDP